MQQLRYYQSRLGTHLLAVSLSKHLKARGMGNKHAIASLILKLYSCKEYVERVIAMQIPDLKAPRADQRR
ncbi:hypothetical protein NITHO_1920004 [Nitrolancea hollandica Lb]|uniref:Uncharacterized protein n=1 Tax=Nitrolancea hollandica Lb TaxID=1129897 RepID=I4EEN1_9BACT|nr:hypothetical protein NITHO_1920004 [Nitrolancea hollandica Lb]